MISLFFDDSHTSAVAIAAHTHGKLNIRPSDVSTQLSLVTNECGYVKPQSKER
jgi:hypothetical protein